MGVDRVTSSLLADAKKEAEEIVKAAEWHVAQMTKEEKAKRPLLFKSAEDEVAKLMNEKERERIAWARLEAKRTIYEAREDAIKSVTDEFFSLLKDVRQHKNYVGFMKRCLSEALNEIGTKEVTVHVGKGDKKCLSSYTGKVLEDLDRFGGLIIESADHKVRVNMTVEELFELKRDGFRKKIFDELFSEGDDSYANLDSESKPVTKTKKKRSG